MSGYEFMVVMGILFSFVSFVIGVWLLVGRANDKNHMDDKFKDMSFNDDRIIRFLDKFEWTLSQLRDEVKTPMDFIKDHCDVNFEFVVKSAKEDEEK